MQAFLKFSGLTLLTLLITLISPPFTLAVPANFQDSAVITGLSFPTAVRFAPNGKVFVAEQSGIVKVFDNLTDTSPTVFADLRSQVMHYADRGLLGLAVDPQFPTRPYIYM